jgi:secreted PhoX family phosphatase
MALTHDELVMVLESPDNICVTPNGGLMFCEDDAVGGSVRKASRSSSPWERGPF